MLKITRSRVSSTRKSPYLDKAVFILRRRPAPTLFKTASFQVNLQKGWLLCKGNICLTQLQRRFSLLRPCLISCCAFRVICLRVLFNQEISTGRDFRCHGNLVWVSSVLLLYITTTEYKLKSVKLHYKMQRIRRLGCRFRNMYYLPLSKDTHAFYAI